MANNLPPIPKDEIKESFVWRDWFQKLSALTSGQVLTFPLATNLGGTNSNAAPTAGAVAYGTGSSYAFTGVGTTGQVLSSNGSGTPTWVTSNSSTTGTSILYGNGSGGFSNVTIGSNLTFTGGTLSATSSGTSGPAIYAFAAAHG